MSPYENAVQQIAENIRRTIAQAKREGTVGMSKACLYQNTPTRGIYLANANVFARAFDDALAIVNVRGFKVY